MAEVPYAHRGRDHLPGHRRHSRAHHAPAQHEDGDGVEDAVGDRARQHGGHGKPRAAVRADDRVDRLPEDVDRNADGDVGEILLRIGEIRLRRAEQQQNRRLEHRVESRHEHANQHAQRHSAANGAVRIFLPVFAEADRHVAARAVADHHSQTQRQHRQREHDVRRAVAKIPHAPADEDLVDDVVQRSHQQRDRTRQGEFHHELPERGSAQRSVLFFFHKNLPK